MELENGGVHVEFLIPDHKEKGFKVLYYCNEGYILEGSRESLCSSEGLWSHPPPKCHSKFSS